MGLGSELRELGDFDNSFEDSDSRRGSALQDIKNSRRGTFLGDDLNQSNDSDKDQHSHSI